MNKENAQPFKKETSTKKRQQHKKSILQEKDGRCYLCVKLKGDHGEKSLHEHHVFGGANRKNSEAEGMKVYLCLEHHTAGPEAVHNNHTYMRMVQQDAQRAFEQEHTRQEFIRIFGRNYLEEEMAESQNRQQGFGFVPLDEEE